jgi:nucleotide-binding universal stress UspA family protein
MIDTSYGLFVGDALNYREIAVMKAILVPTDFSFNAELALLYAGELAKRAEAKVILMHSCDLYEERFIKYKSLVKEHNRTVVKELFGKLNALKRDAKSKYGIAMDVSLYDGREVTGAILQAVKDHRADAIVMGTYGETGMRRKLFGSKTAAIINQASVPVLTIPPTYAWSAPKKLLLTVGDEMQNTDAVKAAFDFAHLFGAAVSVAVFTEEDADAFELVTHTKNIRFIEQKLKRTFPGTKSDVTHIVGTDFPHAIQQLILEKKIDVLSMITHKRNFLENLFDASLTQKMSYHVTVPLLSLHAS